MLFIISDAGREAGMVPVLSSFMSSKEPVYARLFAFLRLCKLGNHIPRLEVNLAVVGLSLRNRCMVTSNLAVFLEEDAPGHPMKKVLMSHRTRLLKNVKFFKTTGHQI